MGMERFGSTEQTQLMGSVVHNIKNGETDRPSLSELPHLENNGLEIEKEPEWRTEDSERESVELPAIENTDAGEKKDIESRYYSTYEERLKQTPREDGNRGEWSGERGESEFIPDDKEVKEILNGCGEESIMYKDGIPDFSEVAEATVRIDDMTENRADNFSQCDEKCSEQWNKEGHNGRTNWAARDVKVWRQENGYSWHERNDMKTCDLVPTKVNDYFGHLGGVSECRKRDAMNGGSDFDE